MKYDRAVATTNYTRHVGIMDNDQWEGWFKFLNALESMFREPIGKGIELDSIFINKKFNGYIKWSDKEYQRFHYMLRASGEMEIVFEPTFQHLV